jgi:S-adenosylmethionine hydrolase
LSQWPIVPPAGPASPDGNVFPVSVLTLLTDFGTTDYYVGAVKGTVLRLLGERAGRTRLVDLSHELPAGDVEAAADLLAAAAPTFPSGTVHLAVVDPGVGSERRILAVRSRDQLFVAPDNGLLTRFFAPESRGAELHSVTRSELFLDAPGSTFHGRDRFAPTAAALLRGEPLEDLGPAIDDPVRLERPEPRREEAPHGIVLHGRIARIDHFGNLVTDLPAAWLDTGVGALDPGQPSVEMAGHLVRRWVDHYAELPDGEPGALVGSLGTVELSLRDGNLAEYWRIRRGESVRIRLDRTSTKPSARTKP